MLGCKINMPKEYAEEKMERILRKIADKEEKLEKFLRRTAGLTKREISRAKFRRDGIQVNGLSAKVNCCIMPGDVVEVKVENEEISSAHLIPSPGELEILYEDEDLLAVNKPAGMVVHPAHGHYEDSLANIVMYYFKKRGEQVRIRCIGRLDKDTSGIVLFAKNQTAAGRLGRQREQGDYVKEYLALTCGIPKEKEGRITVGIRKAQGKLNQMEPSGDGMCAVTNYQVIKEGENHALVRVTLETGRTHQIRVHMAWLGHPLLGDSVYGTGKYDTEKKLERAALHAWRITFSHPFTGVKICLEAPLPEDIQRITG